ncbi:hypothetical protein [Microtetraspora malaysiensis]|uniref:Uncharacterized protein n=1 Tax=Microtetraspora malaysiensis TaxID=161358 RepID=A0ABW6SI15_9ACTN|nr:hypothetical protein [Microtetraspora malaysiensis]
MIHVAVPGFAATLSGWEDPMRVSPPRKGMRPGTAAGAPQTPF